MLENLTSSPLFGIGAFAAGAVASEALRFFLRDYPVFRLSRRAEDVDKAREWCRDCRTSLSKFLLIGDRVIAAGEAKPELYTQIDEIAEDLIGHANNPPQNLSEEYEQLPSNLYELGHAALLIKEMAEMESTSLSEVMSRVHQIESQLQIDDKDIEELLDEIGGLPSGVKGQSITKEHALEQLEVFVQMLAPGVDFSEINHSGDFSKLPWGLVDEEFTDEQRKSIIDQSVVVATQTCLLRYSALRIRQLNQFEESL